MSEVNMWEIEDGHFAAGIRIICGVDEAGRGPLAGPVCAAAVILPRARTLIALAEIPSPSTSRSFPVAGASVLITTTRR